MKAAKVKGGPVEETLMYNSSTYGKIRIFPPRTEDQAFVLVLCKKQLQTIIGGFRHAEGQSSWSSYQTNKQTFDCGSFF